MGRIKAFAVFGLINYILPFFMWNQDMIQSTLPLYLRSIASTLCFLLLVKDYWPKNCKWLLPSYWYFTPSLLFTLFDIVSAVIQ